MKKIISGRKYDTETAREVATWGNGYGRGDFNRVDEWLYQKRTGEYFLVGDGGASSKYAKPYPGGGWQGGSAVMPLTYESAREWAEAHMDADAYEAEFGEVAEDGGEPQILRVSAQAYATLKRESAKTGKTMAALIDELAATL